MAIALAAQMVLVVRRIEDLWWWSWTFVILEVLTALVFVINALVGVADGSPAWPWWLLGGVSGAVAAIGIWALAKTGTERPPT
jgi:hypothetical protein